MFKKTRVRLVLFNTIILLLLLNGLGSAIFFTMQYRLYSQADEELQQIMKHLRDSPFPFLKVERKRWTDLDHRITTLFWNENGPIISKVTSDTIESYELEQLRPTSTEDAIKTIKINGQPYRVFTNPIQRKVFVDGRFVQAQYFQLIYNLGPEEDMLDDLLNVIGIGGAVSIIVSGLIGLFLAKRALIPIQSAWEKQQQFVADASHELRTPLSVIQVHLERLFRYPDHTIEQESENILIGIQETRRLNKLVSDLLTLARSDSNELQLIKQKIQLDSIVTKSVQAFQQLAMIREIQIETQIEESLEIVGDEERLHQLIVILLDNALKYSPDHTVISVSCKKEGHWVTLIVSDTGIGIAKDDLPFVFDRFFQGDRMRAQNAEGTGLGLSIAKWIVEAHGGKIRAESEPGTGTSFYISLPVKGKV